MTPTGRRRSFAPTANAGAAQGGYVVGLTKEQLQGAPTYGFKETPAWGDRAYEGRIHDYYKTTPYWGV